MDEQEKIEKRAHVRLIITEALMFLSVLLLVGFLTLVVMGYSFNLREIGGSGEVVERSGLVQMSSIPTGATIFIDGEAPLLLSTNASRTMIAGEHEIAFKKDGFDEWTKTVNVTQGLMYRLNYARLFRIEREKEDVLTFEKGVSFVNVSPNHERMVYIQNGKMYLLNLNDNKPEKKMLNITNVNDATIEFKTISDFEWSGNSERLLAKVNGAWAAINVRNEKETVWLSDVLKKCTGAESSAEQNCEKIVVSDIKFESEAGDKLLVLDEDGELFEANIREKKLSDVLLQKVKRFDNDGDKIVYLIRSEDTGKKAESVLDDGIASRAESKWQVRAYRVGEEESYLIAGTESEALVATMQYFQDSYVCVAEESSFTIYSKNGWFLNNDDAKMVFAESLDALTASIKKRGKGMVFELNDVDGGTRIFDIEALKTAVVNTKKSGWIDEYLRYRLDFETGEMSVFDYDGLNERKLVEKGVLPGRAVTISGNSKWLYYFVKSETGEKLIREKVN